MAIIKHAVILYVTSKKIDVVRTLDLIGCGGEGTVCEYVCNKQVYRAKASVIYHNVKQ